MRKPFYKESRGTWYCEIDRKQHKLASGPRAATKQAAEDEYHRLMLGHTPATNNDAAVVLIDQFLTWTKKNRNESTYDWYIQHLESFAQSIGPRLIVDAVTPDHVDRWLERKYEGRSDSYRNWGTCAPGHCCCRWPKRRFELHRAAEGWPLPTSF